MQEQQLAMPGDKIGVEEEFIAGENTVVDNGIIRAAIIGEVISKDGKVSVHNSKHEIRKIQRGMYIIGTVSDDLKSVTFIKIDRTEINGVEHIALKDGKIVAAMESPRGRGFGDRDRRGPPQQKTKSCGVGDVVIAKVLFDDPDIYTLGIREPECGVVHGQCELCNAHLDAAGPNMLKCPKCEHTEQRKVSTLYGKPEAIKGLLTK